MTSGLQDDRHRLAWTIALLCLVALALRLGVHARYPGFAHPDETFQYVEPAHRLVFGTGAIPWEFRLGLRNWVLPGALAGVLEVSRLFGDAPWIQGSAVAAAMSLLALVPVICSALWGYRCAALPGAWLAGGLGAVWFEAVYYAPHPLADTAAAALLAGALWLGDPASTILTRRRLIWAGMMLGLTGVVRVQLAPALLVATVALCRLQWCARWLPVLAGAAIPVLLLGLLDRLTWGGWFYSLRMYFWANQIQNIARVFGVLPWFAYPGWMVLGWAWATPLLLLTAVVGAWRLPVLASVWVVTVLTFSLIPHKEERFIYPVLPLLLTLAGVGTARLLAKLPGWRPLRLVLVALALVCWGLISFSLARREGFSEQLQLGTGMVRLMDEVAADPASCGFAVQLAGNDWLRDGGWLTGGYSHLRPGMSLYQALPGDASVQPDAYNFIVTVSGGMLQDTRYIKVTCLPNGPPDFLAHNVCLWRRSGTCDPGSAQPVVAPHEFITDMLQ